MRRLKLTLFALVSLLLCSCSAYKKVPYLQGSEYLDMANVKTPYLGVEFVYTNQSSSMHGGGSIG